MSVKGYCKDAISKLNASSAACKKYLEGIHSKEKCMQPAKDAIASCKKVIDTCREHVKVCKNVGCISSCNASIVACEKAIEKNHACMTACSGSGSADDVKIVCKDCIDACSKAIQICMDSIDKACS